MKKIFAKFYTDLFLGKRLFIALGLSVALFLFSFFLPILGDLPYFFFGALIVLVIIDLVLLYRADKTVFLRREIPDRLSNADENEIKIYLENFYSFDVKVGIIEDVQPIIFSSSGTL